MACKADDPMFRCYAETNLGCPVKGQNEILCRDIQLLRAELGIARYRLRHCRAPQVVHLSLPGAKPTDSMLFRRRRKRRWRRLR